MIDAGLKEPVFEMDAFFRVTFYREPRYFLKVDKETTQKTTQISSQKGTQKKVGVNTEKMRSKLFWLYQVISLLRLMKWQKRLIYLKAQLRKL